MALFNRHGKKPQHASTKPLTKLTAIVKPADLLGQNKRADLIERILEASSLEPARFESLVMALIHQLGRYCQHLPETSTSYYATSGGVLDYALHRTEAALQLFRQFLLQDGHEVSEEQKMWIYVLLSAALLQNIGKLYLDYRVTLYDGHGHSLKEWNPLLESLDAVGHFYDYDLLRREDNAHRRSINVLLAKMLLPASGYAWIAQNPQAFAIWLALIHEDWQTAGTLGAILIRSDALAIQRYLNQFLEGYHLSAASKLARASSFLDSSQESLIEKEQAVGITFIQWLMQSLESGKIMVNKAPLLMVPGGLLMLADIFKFFVREHPEFKNWQAVQHAFQSLGVHVVGAQGEVLSRFEDKKTKQMVSGIVFSNYAIALPAHVTIYQEDNKSTRLSALEFIHQAQFNHQFLPASKTHTVAPLKELAANGQWLNATADVTRLQPRVTHGG